MALTETITAHIARLEQKRLVTRASADAELERLDDAIRQSKKALQLVQATPEFETILKFLAQQGLTAS